MRVSTPDPRGGQGLTYDCVWQSENGARRLLRVRQCQQPWGCVHGFQVGAGGEVGVQVGVRARARVEIGILFLVSLAQAVQFWCEPLRLLESRAEARSLARGVLPTTNRAGRSFPFRTCPSSRPFRLTDRRMVTVRPTQHRSRARAFGGFIGGQQPVCWDLSPSTGLDR